MTIKIMKKSVSTVHGGGANGTKDSAKSSVPVVFFTAKDAYPDGTEKESFLNTFPLASSRYRYSKWLDLDEMTITSDMLHSPRVRKGPKGFKTDTILMLEDDEKTPVSASDWVSSTRASLWKRKKKKRNFQSKLENWELCECVNLSYQDLGHEYQLKDFMRVLRRLLRAERIELIENGLTDLSSVVFPRCKCIYLQRNFISNLKKLPQMPAIEHVSLQQNNISKLDGLESLRSSKLASLILRDNPVAMEPNYRALVFGKIPNLKLLDGLPKLPSDGFATNPSLAEQARTCSIL